jgi:hypothetical protein
VHSGSRRLTQALAFGAIFLFTRSGLVVLVLVCFGCSSQAPKSQRTPEAKLSGQVTGELIAAPASERYVAEKGAYYEQPLGSPDNALPAYPPDLLSQRLPPVSVQVRVVVDDLGKVTSITSSEQPSLGQLPFVESIRSTLQGWKFTQLVKVIPGDDYTALPDADGSQIFYPGKATALPFHQDYRFIFSQKNGKANVTARSASSPES